MRYFKYIRRYSGSFLLSINPLPNTIAADGRVAAFAIVGTERRIRSVDVPSPPSEVRSRRIEHGFGCDGLAPQSCKKGSLSVGFVPATFAGMMASAQDAM
tara:strand:+ start:3123 stop:3422 length:300 start_codon:yes stop_codon:yes gene_type:complete